MTARPCAAIYAWLTATTNRLTDAPERLTRLLASYHATLGGCALW